VTERLSLFKKDNLHEVGYYLHHEAQLPYQMFMVKSTAHKHKKFV